jgi:hypothetical protein
MLEPCITRTFTFRTLTPCKTPKFGENSQTFAKIKLQLAAFFKYRGDGGILGQPDNWHVVSQGQLAALYCLKNILGDRYL